MTARLKGLERRLACLRAQVVLHPIAEDFAESWQQALERGEALPDVLDLVETAGRAAVPVLSLVPIDAYLKQCARSGRAPDPNRMVTAVVHGFAEANLMGMNGETCTCPARRPLLKRPPRSFGGPSGPLSLEGRGLG